MRKAAKGLGVWLGGVIASTAGAAPPSAMPAAPVMPAPMTAPLPVPARVNLADAVAPEFRDAVLKVVRNPTITTRAAGEEVVCTVSVYEWLFDHPDRVAIAWQRLKVPTVAITDLGGGRFAWTDENGSEVVWQTVGTFPDGLVWYASGKIKSPGAIPTIPVQGVIVVTRTKKSEKDGVALYAPNVQCFMHSDSRAANLVLRILGPTGPRVAEEAAEQLLDFFGGIGAYVQKNPTKAEALLAPAK